MIKVMKRMLLGIAVVLFGGAIASSHLSDDILTYVGWGIALVGLVISLTGYFMSENK